MVGFYERVYRELKQYATALGWWNAVPQPRAGDAADLIEFRPISRLKMAQEAMARGAMDVRIILPHIHPTLNYFILCLFEAGPVSQAGEHQIPITWSDLDAWQRGSGVSLPPWQLHLIRRLSADYLTEVMAARDPARPPPWEMNLDADRRTRIAKHVKKILRG